MSQDTISRMNASFSEVDSSTALKRLVLPGTDTIRALKDSLSRNQLPLPKQSALKDKVEYSAKDSLRFNVKTRAVTLYNQADIKYQDIKLNAAFVEINFPDNLLFATGSPDSTGKDKGVPDFTQGDQKFKSKSMRYNYNTKQGYIQNVVTQQDEGYLHGTIVKKMENNITYLKDGTYTTCSHEDHPDFGFKFSKAKVIPGKSVITGPAYMTISDVPVPIALPFGYFPNRTGRRSGIFIPSYGESNAKGFYLRDLGYYFGISEYMDLEIKGDIFSHGSWAVRPSYTYRSRYHFNGQFRFTYAYNVNGTYGQQDYSKSKDFSVHWTHSQDAKARPRSSFSANVNIQSSSFNKNTFATSTTNYLSNTFQSSINYATNWAGKYFLNINLSQSQNTLSKTINITFPQIAFSVNQFYPFKRKVKVGSNKWYEKISTKYNFDAQNNYNTVDSLFMAPGWEKMLKNGLRHSIPVSASAQVLKYFNWTNGINFTDFMYFQTSRMRFISDTSGGYYKEDTLYGFTNAVNASFSSSVSTRLYGMYQFKGNGVINAVRHVITPSVGFSYVPNFGAAWLGYWRYAENDTATINPRKYSIFKNNVYGGPPQNSSGSINFALKNNIEMKVRNRKDTITGSRKVVLIEDLTISAGYDIAKDSLKWSMISIRGYTTLFKGLSIQYTSTWDPYYRTSKGVRINTSNWKMTHKLLNMDNTTWHLGFDYSLSSDKAKGKKKTPQTGTPQEQQDLLDYYDYYIDFDIPWSFSVRYTFDINQTWAGDYTRHIGKVTQTLGVNGQLNITPKWKVSFVTGWDFTNSEVSYTSLQIYRDLHCWEMSFGWVPKGPQKSWNFSINVKASMLQDMKLNKKKDPYDSNF